MSRKGLQAAAAQGQRRADQGDGIAVDPNALAGSSVDAGPKGPRVDGWSMGMNERLREEAEAGV